MTASPPRVCFLTDKPDHPLLTSTAALLTRDHRTRVSFANPATLAESGDEPADVYLLKSHTPQAIRLARTFERRGARVVNSAAATELCQDRVLMAETALAAGLPFPVTRDVVPLSRITAPPPSGHPFIVKSRANRRGDVVARIDTADDLRELARKWPDEQVVVQDYTTGDGWDHKLWVIAGRVFTAVRPSPLEKRINTTNHPPPPREAMDLARRAGEAFALDVYGVDVITDAAGRPLIVDINAFPGFRGGEGAPQALAALISSATMDACERDTEFPSV
ncbi:alpha-L-glutamate ligase [Streptomyces sp. NPDC006733]|uniref:ATP-grasp domain-containing protein n=1 Tax=Streptomyces sp. NPDC006733 TaxID=3155460 RepID=UPI0033D0F567